MPATQIDIRMQYSLEQEQQLLHAVFDALQQSFQLPQYDRNIRLQVHMPERFQVFDLLTQPEIFPILRLIALLGVV